MHVVVSFGFAKVNAIETKIKDTNFNRTHWDVES